jgi:hypothetical protein
MTSSATPLDMEWDDARWVETSDNAWQRGLRWQQAWWRAMRLELPAGPYSADRPDRLVASTLALDAPPDANFLTADVAGAVEQRLRTSGGGLVKEDRLRRFLLSSQPMCFNLFGQFQAEQRRDALLPWVRRVSPGAVRVTRVEIEWAPPAEDHFRGGSAFDAFVEYDTSDSGRGFLGVECKYHEDLRKSDVPKVRDVYKSFTADSGLWREGAVEQLDRMGLRQFWLNTLLAQSLLAKDDRYSEGACVVTACQADQSARAAFASVQAQLVASSGLVWQPWESIVSDIVGHDRWRQSFIERYLDFTPVRHLLRTGDPRLESEATD